MCSDYNPVVEVSCETPVCRSDLAGARESLSRVVLVLIESEGRGFWDGGRIS